MNKQPTVKLIESLFGQSKEYIDNRLELLKLKVVDKASEVTSSLIFGAVLFVISFIFFIVLNIGIALLIGDLIGKSYIGFLILAGFYAIVGLVLYLNKNKFFKTPVTKMIIGKFL